jgi:hypothetical protein
VNEQSHNKARLTRLLVWSALLLVIIAGWFWFQRAKRDVMERANPTMKVQREREEQMQAFDTGAKKLLASATNSQPHLIHRLTELSDGQKADISKLFNEKFSPVLMRWSNAYSNRIPFDVSQVTMDKFHSTLGARMYTFMIGDTTLTFMLDQNGENPCVGYMMVRQAALAMNRLPAPGTQPSLATPITSAQVLDMVNADTGTTFKPNEVIIRPTGKASAMNGGAFVDLLPTGADPNNFLNYKLSMTFDSNGMLVDYERDPNF